MKKKFIPLLQSEIAALKEVIDKWRTRALEAEAMKEYYCGTYEIRIGPQNVADFIYKYIQSGLKQCDHSLKMKSWPLKKNTFID